MSRGLFVYLPLSLLMTTITLHAFTLNPLCNKSCPECTYLFPTLEEEAKALRSKYLSVESSISERYQSRVTPLLEERERLLSKFDALVAELEVLDKIMLLKQEEVTNDRVQQLQATKQINTRKK